MVILQRMKDNGLEENKPVSENNHRSRMLRDFGLFTLAFVGAGALLGSACALTAPFNAENVATAAAIGAGAGGVLEAIYIFSLLVVHGK